MIEDFGLSTALEEFCEEFAKAQGINLRFDGPAADAGLSADGASCLYRIAQECLRNVAKHARATEVRVGLTSDGANMQLVVKDNGAGFPVEPDRANSGLGLVSMKERIRMANGTLSITSQPGQGTEIVASVPLSGGLSVKRLRILLGDDHALILNGIKGLVESHYEVVGSEENGKALIEAALRLKPDLVVLDVSMPILNGIDAAREIKKALPSTKLVFLSMHSNAIYLRKALEAGASGYVLKSGAAEELLTGIEEARKGNVYVTPNFGQDVIESVREREG